MLLKWIRIRTDLEVHDWLEKIQVAEKSKFSYLKKRRKEEIASDVLKEGIASYIKSHQLEIKL